MITGHVWPFDTVDQPRPQPKRLYSTKQTPRGSVVVLGDRIISDYEMPHDQAQHTADWLNHTRHA